MIIVIVVNLLLVALNVGLFMLYKSPYSAFAAGFSFALALAAGGIIIIKGEGY